MRLRTVEVHRERLRRAGPRCRFRARHRHRRPARRRVRQRRDHHLRAGQRRRNWWPCSDRMPQFVFEAHSTDYQPAGALAALVRDGFAILKVGPWLTFALREALYGLSHIADVLAPDPSRESLPAAMERVMLASPGNWREILSGHAGRAARAAAFLLQRPHPLLLADARCAARDAGAAGGAGREGHSPPADQPVPRDSSMPRSRQAGSSPSAHELLIGSVTRVLDIYAGATGQ